MCEGYRTESEVLFRESGKASSASGIRGRRSGSTSLPPSKSDLDQSTQRAAEAAEFAHQLASCGLTPQYASPTESMEDQALCFFFSRYATSSQPINHQPSFYTHLPKMCQDSAEDHTLKRIVSAIGLGGLAARRGGDPKLLIAADAAYNNALRLTNHALCERETAISDQTLVGVLLLGLYEVFYSISPL